MSCEGNRHRFFSFLQSTGMDPLHLEKLYQHHKSRGSQNPEDEVVHTHKTRQLFAVMQSEGIKPPAHAASGLPKKDSRSGYAAIYDAIQSHYSAKRRRHHSENPLDKARERLAGVKDSRGFDMSNGLNDKKANRWGWRFRRKLHPEPHNPDFLGRIGDHVWFGDAYSLEKITTFIDSRSLDFLRPPEDRGHRAVPEDFLKANAQGLLADGFDLLGFDAQGYDSKGYDLYGIHKSKKPLSDADALEIVYNGDHINFNRGVYDRRSQPVKRTRLKKPREYDVDIEGFADDGFLPRYPEEKDDKDRLGFNRHGFKDGRSWTGYDEQGLDKEGKPRAQVKGYDAFGYHRKDGLTEPDKKGRRYNLIGWQYDKKTDTCFNPRNPQERMPHSGSFKYSRNEGKLLMTRSYVPSEKELAQRLRTPSIRRQEVAEGSDCQRYSARDAYDRREMIGANSLAVRYLRSESYAKENPDGHFSGIRLRCNRCGQFTGAQAHQCPKTGNKNILLFHNGIVAEVRPDTGVSYSEYGLERDVESIRFSFRSPEPDSDDIYATRLEADSFLGLKGSRQVLTVLETPFNPDFDAEYEGGPIPGYSYTSGLDRDGYDLAGFDPETGLNRDGSSMSTLLASKATLDMVQDKFANPETTDEKDRQLLQDTFSGVASALAGAPRRVTIEEKGGPRDGMFGTNLKGRITAERYPLGKDAPTHHNLLAMKAGIYHEIGHEEDTPPEIWARALQIAQGGEDVAGLSKTGAQKVAELFNIVEDGRMERIQAKRRRGVATILANDAKINPRWDEAVGKGVGLEHQVTGMMLYRALPFFLVKEDVYKSASPRARQLFDEITPLVDRATSSSAEEALFAAVEIARKLDQDEEIKKERQAQQAESRRGKGSNKKGQGAGQGKGKGYIITATPQSVQRGHDDAQHKTPIPAPGWGKRKERQDENPKGSGRQKGLSEGDEPKTGRPKSKQEDEPSGKGRAFGQKPEDEPRGTERQSGKGVGDEAQSSGRKKGASEEGEPSNNSRIRGQGKDEQSGGKRPPKRAEQDQKKSAGGGSDTPQFTRVAPEPDQSFFFDVRSSTDLVDTLNSVATEAVSGTQRRERLGGDEKKAAQQLCQPSQSMRPTISVEVGVGDKKTRVFTPNSAEYRNLRRYDGGIPWDDYDKQAKSVGKRLGQRLERLKASIRQRQRYQTSGRMDRKRFKRAVAGSRAVYQQHQDMDMTSLAVSVNVDMSGSMGASISNGELFGAVSAIGAAMDTLKADYGVNAFGSTTHLLKSIGDKEFPLETKKFLGTTSLGGTKGAASVASARLSLEANAAVNKLAFVLTDGAFSDKDEVIHEVKKARKKGIIPFGMYFGKMYDSDRKAMDKIYGAGSWAQIESLEDLPTTAANRIERIYRRVLASL